MKSVFISTAIISAFLAGCASTQTGRVESASDGTRVYGLTTQPQTALVGSEPLMPGADSSHTMVTGQFTGQERSHDVIGQQPIPPNSDARELARTSKPPIAVTGIGAGSLGQTGIIPDRNITSGTLIGSNLNPPTANPPTVATAPTLSEPLTSEMAKRGAIGAAPGPESGGANNLTNNVSAARIPRPDEPLRAIPVGPDTTVQNSAAQDLPAQIRETLSTGRPGTLTRLSPDRVQRLDIEALNGNVTLRGDVRSEVEKLLIGNKVAQMEGVRSLNNQLRVTGPGTDTLGKPLQPKAANELQQ